MVPAQKQKYRSMEQDRKPRDKLTHIWSPYLLKETRVYSGEKADFSIIILGKLGSYMQKNQTGLLSHTIWKNKLKMD